jgi:hypothetical protein
MKSGVNRLQGRNSNYMDFNPDGSTILSSGNTSILINTDSVPTAPVVTPSTPSTVVVPNLSKTTESFETIVDIIPVITPIDPLDIRPTASLAIEYIFATDDIPDEEEFFKLYGDIVGIITEETSISVSESTPLEGNSNIIYSNNKLSGFFSTSKDNNPFNIINTTTRWKGKIGYKETLPDEQGRIRKFVVFDTIENGTRAGLINLSGYFTKYKLKTINQIINRYAPPGTAAQSAEATKSYIKQVVDYMKKNYSSSITESTILTFNGYSETNSDNIKMFKILVKAILKVEGGLTSAKIQAIDNFDIKNLK